MKSDNYLLSTKVHELLRYSILLKQNNIFLNSLILQIVLTTENNCLEKLDHFLYLSLTLAW